MRTDERNLLIDRVPGGKRLGFRRPAPERAACEIRYFLITGTFVIGIAGIGVKKQGGAPVALHLKGVRPPKQIGGM